LFFEGKFPMAHSLAHSNEAMAGQKSPGGNQPSLDSQIVWQARIDLAACFRMAARYGCEEGICNHFSALVPGYDDLFLVNPYGFAFRELTASKLLICDFQGNVVAGEGQPEATAFYIHARIHRNLPRPKVAFHTPMPYATALSMTEGDPLIFAGQTALKFSGRTTVDHDYNGLALDEREGDRIAGAIGDADIVFMKHDGAMVLGPNYRESLGRSLLSGARLPGADAGAFDRPQGASGCAGRGRAEAAFRQMREGDPKSARLHLESTKRQLDREEPEFRH
jgi:ribulose-5-phosphate 4-epimerase/fuculose-1-phosphate aldolase